MFIQGNCFMVHQASIKVLLLMTNSTLTKLFIPSKVVFIEHLQEKWNCAQKN